MLKQYKLRFYNFRLILFLIAISLIGVTLVGTAAPDLRSKQFSAGNYNYVSPFLDGLFLDYELSVDYVWLQYYNAAGCAYCW